MRLPVLLLLLWWAEGLLGYGYHMTPGPRVRTSPLYSQDMTATQIVAPTSSPHRIFIFGLGYVGCALAEKLTALGWHVSGTCTSLSKAKALRARNIHAYLYDASMASPLALQAPAADISSALSLATHVLSTVPPTSSGPYSAATGSAAGATDSILQTFGNILLTAALGPPSAPALSSTSTPSTPPTTSSSPANPTSTPITSSPPLQWIGYLSSTGVYGDRSGGWVTEVDLPDPDRPKTRARLDAERQWRSLHSRSGLPVHVFRLAGIYGPGRSAADTVLRNSGDFWACQPDESAFISRIHVDDICQTLLCSALKPQPGLVVNVADDLPATRFDVLAYACRLLEVPVLFSGREREMERERGSERGAAERGFSSSPSSSLGVRGGSKRVDNALLRALLLASGAQLIYPDYRSGLQAVVAGMPVAAGVAGYGQGAAVGEGSGVGDSVLDRIALLEGKLRAMGAELRALKGLVQGEEGSQQQRWRQED